MEAVNEASKSDNAQPEHGLAAKTFWYQFSGVQMACPAKGSFLRVLKTPVRAPQANAFCERLIGTENDCAWMTATGGVAEFAFRDVTGRLPRGTTVE